MFNEKNIYNLFVEADSLDNDLSHLKFEIQKNEKWDPPTKNQL